MRVTAQEEYGLRCMMQVAAASADRPLTVHEIGSREGLSDAYVAKLMNLLRDAGVVDSIRGRSGGYFIVRPPDQVSVSEILAALGGHIFEEHYCDRFPGESDECVHTTECSIRSLWGTLEGLVERVLRRTTLTDLMKPERDLHDDLMRREAERQGRRLPMAPEELRAATAGQASPSDPVGSTGGDRGGS